MALVFPVVHDFAGGGVSQWETLSSTALLGDDPEINPFPNDIGDDVLFTPPIRHDGKITLQYQQTDGTDVFPRVARQLNNGTWETLGAAQDLGFSLTQNSQRQGIFSHNGSLYAACLTYPKTFPGHFNQNRLRIFKYNESTNVWTQETNTSVGLSSEALNGGARVGHFFVIEGTLYYRWMEPYYLSQIGGDFFTIQYRLVVAEENNGSWSRVATFNGVSGTGDSVVENDNEDAFAVANGHLYSMRRTRIFRFTPGSGIEAWSANRSSTTGGFTADWGDGQVVVGESEVIRNFTGSPVIAFRGPSTSVPDKYFVSTINSTSGSYTRSDINNPTSDLSFRSMAEANGEEYVLFNKGAGSENDRGLVLYRKNGNSWSLIGGGLAVQGNSFSTDGTFFRIFSGYAYIFARGQNAANTKENYVIRRFQL